MLSNPPVGVNVKVNGCLSLCNSLAIDWGPVQDVPCLSPYDGWDRLQAPGTAELDKQKKWMDGCLPKLTTKADFLESIWQYNRLVCMPQVRLKFIKEMDQRP